jgi:signal transduction histidine kinase
MPISIYGYKHRECHGILLTNWPLRDLNNPSALFTKCVDKFLIYILIGFSCYFLYAGCAVAQEVKIALRATQGSKVSLQHWQPTADYLSRKLPGYTFKMVPFEINSTMNQAVSRGGFAFVFADPAAYVELNKRYGVSAIATLVNKGAREGESYDKFGSVIFTRADRSDISTFKDLKGKTFMAVDELGFGGWRIAWRELLTRGVDPYRDFKLLSFAGGIQQNVVYAVRDGDVDAGCVRTDMLERMAKRGAIRMQEFKVLEPRDSGEIDFVHSTRLYPEWPFAKSVSTPVGLSNQVTEALFRMPSDNPAAVAGSYSGWIKPLDYRPVDDLLQDLAIGPYETSLYFKSKQLLKYYWEYFLIAVGLFIGVGLTAIMVLIANRRLTRVKKALEVEIQKREKVQQKLEQHQQQLEAIVAERTASLQAHNEELESYSYSIAHDLRTPLRAIVSFGQILAEDTHGKLNNKDQDALRRITSAGKHMATLIDDILELSRITRSGMTVTTVNISQICNQIIADLQAQDPGRHVNWYIASNLQASGDAKLIRVLLQNLLDNAWKYSSAKDPANIEVAKLSRPEARPEPRPEGATSVFPRDKHDVFYVRDNGIGFEMTYKDKIFKPFHRLQNGEFEGTGVGLATVKRIVQRHGGSAWAEGKLNRGTTVYFSLPKANAGCINNTQAPVPVTG